MRTRGVHRRAEMVRAGDDIRDDFGIGRIRHRRLEHSDHCGGAGIQADYLADDRRVATQRSRPEAMRQHRSGRRVRSIVLRGQEPAEHGPKAHHVEERSSNHARSYHAGLATEPCQGELDDGEIAERADGGDA